MQTTHSPRKKLITEKNSRLRELVSSLPSHAKQAQKTLRDQHHLEEFLHLAREEYGDGRTVTEYLFLVRSGQNPPRCSKTQDELSFVGLSVGYKFCGPAGSCQCAKEAVSKKVAESKSQYTDSRKEQIKQKRKDTNLEKFGVEHTFKSPSIKEKIKATNRKKYGCDNPQQNDEIREKTQDTLVERYGVTNPIFIPGAVDQIRLTNLERYGVDNAFSNTEIQQKYKQTMLERHGVENPAKSPAIMAIREKTMTERYGVTNLFKSPEYQAQLHNQAKENYYERLDQRVGGKVFPLFSKEEYLSNKEEYLWGCKSCGHQFYDKLLNGRTPICRVCFPVSVSSGHRELCDYLDELNISYEVNDRNLIAPKELDILVESHRVAIEYCGLYWHSENSGGKDSKYHLEKLERTLEKGYRLLTVFSDEWQSNRNLVKDRIRSILKCEARKLYARKCQVEKITNQEAYSFCEQHHLMGGINSKHNYGLKHNGILVSVMTFSKTRFDKTGWELVRYCSDGIVVGGAQKLFKRFLADHPDGDIVSYADRRWSDGDLYRTLGFEESSPSKPGYWYFNSDNVRMHRLNFTKQKLIKNNSDPNKTEWEIMVDSGFDRIWDCGQLVFYFRRGAQN